MLRLIKLRLTMLCMGVMAYSNVAYSQWQADISTLVYKVDHNVIHIPNTSLGDRFDTNELGQDDITGVRLALGYQPNENYQLQFVYSPFVYSQTGTLERDIRFEEARFVANQPLTVRYQFNNYRVRYLHNWFDDAHWNIDLGGTLFIRDASITLTQNDQSSVRGENSNLGFVPLIAARVEYKFDDAWSVLMDTDFLFGGRGRAIDLALQARYRFNNDWRLALGHRSIEGGVDNSRVYNFAWFKGTELSLNYAW